MHSSLLQSGLTVACHQRSPQALIRHSEALKGVGVADKQDRAVAAGALELRTTVAQGVEGIADAFCGQRAVAPAPVVLLGVGVQPSRETHPRVQRRERYAVGLPEFRRRRGEIAISGLEQRRTPFPVREIFSMPHVGPGQGSPSSMWLRCRTRLQ